MGDSVQQNNNIDFGFIEAVREMRSLQKAFFRETTPDLRKRLLKEAKALEKKVDDMLDANETSSLFAGG